MDVNFVSNAAQSGYCTRSTSCKTSKAAEGQVQETEDKAAVYEKETSEEKVSYKPDRKTVKSMLAQTEQKMSSLTNLVEKLFNKQGLKFEESIGMLKDAIESGMSIDADTVAKAKEDVAEDGYFGSEKTSKRILDFAKALSGGDPAKAEKMREAVEKGFKEAEKMWGGELPDLCKETYDKVMAGFDEWQKSE